jgi:hypothetical protein
VATMTKLPEIGEIRPNAEGVEYIFEACGRCDGTGHYSFNPLDGTRCFDCRGRRGHWVTKADHDRRKHNRELAAKRREAKAAAQAAELPRKIAATIEANPILAELLKLDDYSGILGSFRSQLENKGTLSDKQIALARRILIESAERQAHAENERRGRVEGPIGEIGDRREFTGKVLYVDHKLDTFKRYEAYKTFMIVATNEGAIKWQASKYIAVERGEQITIKATVKAHDADKQDRIITVVTKGTVLGK